MIQQKIKILYIMDHFLHPAGGTEGQVYNLIRNIDKTIFQATLCLFRFTSDYFERNTFPCPVISLNIDSFYSISSYYKLWKLRKYIIANGFDIVQTIFNETALTIPIVAYRTGSKIISSRRDMGFWYTSCALFTLNKIVPFVDKYLVNSYAVKENIKEKEGVPDRKIEVIYNAHDFSRFRAKKSEGFLKQQGIPEGSYIIGIVANLRPVKRVKDLILAFCDILLRYPDSFLVVMGDPGNLLKEYKELTVRRGIQDNVRFLGPTENVIPVIKNFTVGVVCSESEGMSNVIIEYMGCNIPVVATSTGGNAELIRHQQTGLLVPVGKPKVLASAISILLDNPDTRQKMAQRCRQLIEKAFLNDKIYAHYETFYKTLLE